MIISGNDDRPLVVCVAARPLDQTKPNICLQCNARRLINPGGLRSCMRLATSVVSHRLGVGPLTYVIRLGTWVSYHERRSSNYCYCYTSGSSYDWDTRGINQLSSARMWP